MKKVLLTLSFITLSLFSSAQCTGCSITISGSDNNPYIVPAGTTLCISSTGTATGNILVSGGTLCNSGIINTSHLMVENSGSFNNYGSALIDSLLITDSNSALNNYGTISNITFLVAASAMATNNGDHVVNNMADSAATYINNGSLIINNVLAHGYGGYYSNSGSNAFMKISGNFYNSGNSDFYVGTCMINVGGDWYNMATISGPPTTSGCGGFNVSGISYNSGNVSNVSSHVDICDAGNPPSGIDANTGVIASTTTYCTCTNVCVTGLNPSVWVNDISALTVFPVPATDQISISFRSEKAQKITVMVTDLMGRNVHTASYPVKAEENILTLETGGLQAGNYIVKLQAENGGRTASVFNITK